LRLRLYAEDLPFVGIDRGRLGGEFGSRELLRIRRVLVASGQLV
jgi:hypothetical protein